MVRVEEATALVVVLQAVGGEGTPAVVSELQPSLAAVGAGQPTEVVIEGAVLHHQDDKRVDGEVARRGKRHLALAASGLRHQSVGIEKHSPSGAEAPGDCGALEEVAPGFKCVWRDGQQPLR